MQPVRLILVTLLLVLFFIPGMRAQEKVYRYGRFEQAFTAAKEYADPLRAIELKVQFTGPNGERETARGFWDGGRTWKVRFSPGQAGEWKWSSTCSDAGEKGLVKSGSFRAWEYWGRNEIYRHGTPRVSADRRHLVHADGKPWLWLADTAWNGALLSTRNEWSSYARDRGRRKFSAVQFVLTQWRGARADEAGQVAFGIGECGPDRYQPGVRATDLRAAGSGAAGETAAGTSGRQSARCLHVNPTFFQRMEEKFAALNDEGLVAAPVLLWDLFSADPENPLGSLSAEDAIALARYMVARYDAFQVVWILTADGDYAGANAARWKAIGRAVFPASERQAPAPPTLPATAAGTPGQPPAAQGPHPVAMLPRAMQSPWAEYKGEPWLDLFFYQSGHGDDAAKWRWNAIQGGAVDWRALPPHPVLDAEINYEGQLDSSNRAPIGPAQVRRAAYYSLLAAPPAGVSYGAYGIWSWSRQAGTAFDPRTGVAQPWTQCLDYPGAREMTVLRDLFNSVEWWKLRPDRTLLVPGRGAFDYERYPVAAVAEDNSFAIVYLPDDSPVTVNLDRFQATVDAVWIDPTNGQREVVLNWRPRHEQEMRPPTGGDWLLLLRAPKSW